MATRRVLVVGAGVTAAATVRAMSRMLRSCAPPAAAGAAGAAGGGGGGDSALTVECHVWEKSRDVGGRFASQLPRVKSGDGAAPSSVGDGDGAAAQAFTPQHMPQVDLGMQYLSFTDDEALADADVLQELQDKGLLRRIDESAVHGSPDPDHSLKYHFVASSGSRSLVREMFESVERDTSSPIKPVLHFKRALSSIGGESGLHPHKDGVLVTDQDGVAESFDAVLLTMPVPQIVTALETSPCIDALCSADAKNAELFTQLKGVKYCSRYAAALFYPPSPQATSVASDIGALSHYVTGDLTMDGAVRYVSNETFKRGEDVSRVGLSLLLHSSKPFGAANETKMDDGESRTAILNTMESTFQAMYPSAAGLTPLNRRLLYWRFSQVTDSPFSLQERNSFGFRTGSSTPGPLFVAGDAISGSSGFANCLKSGADAAEDLISCLGFPLPSPTPSL